MLPLERGGGSAGVEVESWLFIGGREWKPETEVSAGQGSMHGAYLIFRRWNATQLGVMMIVGGTKIYLTGLRWMCSYR